MCCGRDAQRSTHTPAMSDAPSSVPVPRREAGAALRREVSSASRSKILFEYVGKTGLTVVGPITGRRYRFEARGSRLAVDSGDQPSLAVLPQLRQVAG